ncbi:ABC transporter permease subunit [Nocardioides coralli]|uniref:ABC transporter permease subunit n=1 Tax=Nocardioides coralli TaxID=2872154 RepID=UPI001CA4219E|nr:ABC transporter permease [Nocardioides coralli]QZY29953.1 ABC transporter permease [Nocardioides coralli]
MNPTVARLTARTLLGRKRTLLLTLLPLALLALCTLARVLAGFEPDLEAELGTVLAANLLGGFALAVMMPLLGLIAGTGAIGPEIDEGSIVYLLAKPLNRYSIVVTKLAVAVGVIAAFGVLPTLAAGAVLGASGTVVLAFGLGVTAAGATYAALFLALAVLTRNAVVVGLIYALIWETLVGGLVPGAQALSVQQWSLAVVERVLGDSAPALGVSSAVDLSTAVVLLLVVAVGATAYAGRRLQTLRLGGET